MRLNAHTAVMALVVWGAILCCTRVGAQTHHVRPSNRAKENAGQCDPSTGSHLLTPDEGLGVIAAALDRRSHLRARRDCSHLVHAIYDVAGFAYPYASSSDLYAGSDKFERVTDAQPGDLVVWRGHVGIVVNPAQHIFFSSLRTGPGIDTYDAPHWKRRGQVRFYRYIQQCSPRPGDDHFLLTHQER